MRHLSDNEIQSYLQSDRSDKWKLVEAHLSNCSDCRNQLLLYEKLGKMVLFTSSKPTPKTFKRTVMRRIKRMQRQKRMTDGIVAGVALLGLSFAIAIVMLTPQLKEIVTGYLMEAWEKGTLYTTTSSGMIDALTVFLFGMVLLIFYAVIDRLAMANLRTTDNTRI